MAQLIAQARLNAGDATARGRSADAQAWRDVELFLSGVCGWCRSSGHALPAQLDLFSDELWASTSI